jgi:hypothetical protein
MKEITEKGKLLDKNGNLNTTGWARQPLLDANLEDLSFYAVGFLEPMRVKRWQYFGITTPTHFFSFTLSNVGYLAPVFAYMLDFRTCKYCEETINVPFGKGVVLPRNSTEGDCHYKKGDMHMHFYINNDNMRQLDVEWPKFGAASLKASISLELAPGHESVVNVFPFKNKRFFYTRKVNCMQAQGSVEYGWDIDEVSGEIKPHVYSIDPQCSLGNLDWGDGVWPYRSFWIWASFSQYLSDGRTLGLNLGGGIGNDPGVTDNAFILNGRVNKLGKVDFKYDTSDFKKPWQMKSDDGRLELEFVPFFERLARTNAVVLASEVHQMFGRYSGKLVMDDEEKIEIDGLIGWAEEHHAKW